ncbi:MAG: glycosyltransferase [Verrucomicrobiota bacterium]
MKRRTRETVVVLAAVTTAYRPGCVIKAVLDRQDIELVFLSTQSFSSLPDIMARIARIFSGIVQVVCSDTLFVMNHWGFLPRCLIAIAKVLGKRVIADYYISSYETAVVDRKVVRPESREARKLKQGDSFAIKYSSPVIFLNESERDYYLEVAEVDRSCVKTEVIPLVCPARPQAMLPFINGKVDGPTFVWWGGHGNPIHGFERIAAATRIFLDKMPNARFGFFGTNNPFYETVRQKYKDIAENPNVIFSNEFNFQNGRLTEYLLNSADYAFGIFGGTRKAKTVLANKIVDAASFGIPCLTQESAGTREYFTSGTDLFYCDADPMEIAQMMSMLVKEPSLGKAIGHQARKLFEREFSPEQFEPKVATLFD